MDPRIQDALQRCIHAINLTFAYGYDPTEEQTAHLRALAAGVQPIIDQLAVEPYKGKGLGIGYTPRGEWQSAMFALRGSHGGTDLCWKDRIQVLFDSAGLEADTMLSWVDQVNDPILRDHLLLHVAADLTMQVQEHRVETDILPRLRPDRRYRAMRVILDEYARRVDVTNFLKQLKKTDRRQERHVLRSITSRLVQGVVERSGIEAALQLCETKALNAYTETALYAFAKTIDLDTLKTWLTTHPAAVDEPGLTERLMIAAYEFDPSRAEQDFAELFERVVALDKSIRWGNFSMKDSLLLDLGYAVGPGPHRDQCRRKISNNVMKRELSWAPPTSD